MLLLQHRQFNLSIMNIQIKIAIFCIVYIGLNAGLGIWHSSIVNNNKRVGNPAQINHWLWGALYVIFCIPVWLVFKEVWFLVAAAALHASIFPVVYNTEQGLPPFHLSTTSTSLIDRAQVKLGLKTTEIFNLAAFALFLSIIVICLWLHP